jgi:hypothetical protein
VSFYRRLLIARFFFLTLMFGNNVLANILGEITRREVVRNLIISVRLLFW